jgi:hypothetical protein
VVEERQRCAVGGEEHKGRFAAHSERAKNHAEEVGRVSRKQVQQVASIENGVFTWLLNRNLQRGKVKRGKEVCKVTAPAFALTDCEPEPLEKKRVGLSPTD